MIQEALSNFDYSFCAVMALVLFLIAFFLIGFKAFFTSREETQTQANLPLSDGQFGDIDG